MNPLSRVFRGVVGVVLAASPFHVDLYRTVDDTRPAPPSGASGTVPGEFELQGALVFGCGEFAGAYPHILTRIVTSVERNVPLYALVNNKADPWVREALEADGVGRGAIFELTVPHDTSWIRDYGPLSLRLPDGQIELIDPLYNNPERAADDAVPAELARRLGLRRRSLPLVLDGGNLLSNGDGLCVTSTEVLTENPGVSEDEIRDMLRDVCGCEQTIILEPLEREDTGHVDMFVTIVSRQKVVVGSYDRDVDPDNADLLDRNAGRLAEICSPDGFLDVVRMPMPPNLDGVWRSYTNVVFANGVLLVPIYPEIDEDGGNRALALFGTLLPAWKVVGIDSEDLAEYGGALHCASLNLPAPSFAGQSRLLRLR